MSGARGQDRPGGAARFRPGPAPVRIAHARAYVLPLLLAACATTTPPPPSAQVSAVATPEQMLGYIRSAAGDGEGELDVRPLRDSQVEDLRERAARLQREGYHRDAAEALDQAMALVPDDPGLLQEAAEAALLLGDFARAGGLADRALQLGSGVGPLCRRHRATQEQVRLALGDAGGAAEARAAIEACRVAAPQRW